MRRLVVPLLVTLAACTASGDATTIPVTASSTSTAVATTGSGGGIGLPPCLTGEAPFRADGILGTSGRDRADAVTVADIRLDEYAPSGGLGSGCERVTIVLATATGAPATAVARVSAEVLGESAVVRLFLPAELTGTAVANIVFEGTFVDRVYVVNGGSEAFIDVHLASPALARFTTTASPARLVVDVRSGDRDSQRRPTVTDSVVIVEPGAGDETYPFTVRGYARSSLPVLPVVVHGAGDEVATIGTVTGAPHAWRPFEIDVSTGPGGVVRLQVGEALVPLVMP
jgi:hypothetical protein